MKNTTFDRIITILLLIICVVLAAATYLRGGSSGNEKRAPRSEETVKTVNVSVQEVTSGTYTRTSKVMGEIISDEKDTEVYPLIGGSVSSITVRRGDHVEKGDVIATVDPSKPGMKYKESEVKAPVSGTVHEVNAAVGDTVSASTSLVVIRGERVLKVSTAVSEKNIASLVPGAHAIVKSDSFEGVTWDATISYIDSALDTSSRTLPIELSFTDGSGELLEGMFVTAIVDVETAEDVITVPSTAISSFAGEDVVYIAEDGYAKRLSVTTGRNDGSVTVITSGLSEGDLLITAGSVSDGTPVSIITEEN